MKNYKNLLLLIILLLTIFSVVFSRFNCLDFKLKASETKNEAFYNYYQSEVALDQDLYEFNFDKNTISKGYYIKYIPDSKLTHTINLEVLHKSGGEWSNLSKITLEKPLSSTPDKSDLYDIGHISEKIISAQKIEKIKIKFISNFKNGRLELHPELVLQSKATNDENISSSKSVSNVETKSVGGLEIISRAGWGCPDNNPDSPYYCDGPFWPLSYYPVTHFIIHHTATSNSSNDWAKTVRAIWNNHSHVRDADPHDGVQGWTDIGYNYLIDPNGKIYEGRYGGNGVTAGHVSGHNKGTVGIALLGNFEKGFATQKARDSLINLLSALSEENNISLQGKQIDIKGFSQQAISGHKDWAKTACPGKNLYTDLDSIREKVVFFESNTLPVYRFWSDKFKSHFYTINPIEKSQIINTNPDWKFEWNAFLAKKNPIDNAKPVYRFWSDKYKKHFFTIDEQEKKRLESEDPNWEYEWISYYAYNYPKSGTKPLYRFWSDDYKGHFYTTDHNEKEQIEKNSNNWKYEWIAYYVE